MAFVYSFKNRKYKQLCREHEKLIKRIYIYYVYFI